MDLIVACAACGMDPGTESFLLNFAQAAVIATPWFVRGQLMAGLRSARRRLRGGPRDQEACPLAPPDQTPTGHDLDS